MFRIVLLLLLLTPQLALPPSLSAQDLEQGIFDKCSGSGRITCVVDGDTIWYQGTKIRLLDINTPEISRPECAREAR